MTISNNAPRVQIVADGTTGPFPFEFRIFSEEDVRVFDGATQKALTTDYTVDFDFLDDDADEGAVNFVSGRQPANGAILTIDRDIPTERTVDLQQNGPPVQDELNIDLDKVWAKLQEFEEVFERLVRLADATAFTGDVIFPDGGAAEAGKVVGWASDGLSLENRDVAGAGNVTLPLIVGQGGTGAATADSARANLGVPGLADDNVLAGKTQLNGPFVLTATERTISNGSITATGAAHFIDTEADAVEDDLDVIVQDNTPLNSILLLTPASGARRPTIKHTSPPGAGQIVTADGKDVRLFGSDYIALRRRGDFWQEVARSTPVFPAGAIVQTQVATTTAEQIITNVIPADTSIPQNTEGAQVIQIAFTPRFASSKLLITYNGLIGGANVVQGRRNVTMALFKDDDVSALKAALACVYDRINAIETDNWVDVSFLIDAADTATRTYKIRIGPDIGVNVDQAPKINRSGSTVNLYGAGVLETILKVEEIAQ